MPVKVLEPVAESVIVKEPKQPKQSKEPHEQKQRAPNAWLEFLKDTE